MQTAETVTISKAEYEGLIAKSYQLAQLQRLLFGRKSERFVPAQTIDLQQLMLDFGGEQVAVELEQTVGQLVAAHERKHPAEAKKNEHKGRMPIPEHLERREEIIEPDEDVSDMTCIGEDVTEILELDLGKIWVRRIVRPRYARREENTAEGQSPIVQAPAKAMPLGRSKAGVSLVANIILSKYVEHTPLHRLIQRFARSGLQIPPATMGQWTKNGIDLLLLLYQLYEKLIFGASYLQMDETTLKVLEDGKGKCHLGYLWVALDPVNKLPFFSYHPGRDHKKPKKLLERFAGILQCDGYAVYETVGKQRLDIRLVNCMAHIRREFFEAKSNDDKRATFALSVIKLLYQVEENAKNLQLSADQRLELRLKESKPIFDALGEWLQTNYNLVTPASPIGKAIAYALHRWENMKVFLTDGRIEIDNNLVENAIRPAAIGRKNYLFAGSHESAQRTAMIYTFFSACKQYQIDPEIWLNDVLNRIQDCKISELGLLLPQFWKPKEEGIG